MTRNLVLCLDGTSNEPETDATNVARMFEVATKDESQLVYYDPGVGTMGARGAVTPFGARLTRAATGRRRTCTPRISSSSGSAGSCCEVSTVTSCPRATSPSAMCRAYIVNPVQCGW